jgi:monoamine oxidase
LHDRNHPVLLIEVMKRGGGRASTVMVEGLPLDLGCGWLHSGEPNPLARVAELLSYTVDRSRAAWQDQLHNLGFPVADQNEAWRAYEAFENVRARRRPRAIALATR